MKEYIKEYELEKQLFEEVNRNFEKNKTLSEEEFFKIIIWKSNRSKGIILRGLRKSKVSISNIMRQVYDAKKAQKKVKILVELDGIGLPIASAILTVCYPKKFTILDYRVWSILSELKHGKEGAKTKGKRIPDTIPNYFKYLKVCKNFAKDCNLSLRDADKAIWGKCFYEDLKDFLKK